MEYLGYLTWWTVRNGEVTVDQAQRLMTELGIDVPPPKQILPIDAFRRLTGEARRTYDLEDGQVCTLDLHKAVAQETMLVRHIVRTTKNAQGVTNDVKRVGDVAFYKPPRGKHSKARMRVTVHARDPHVESFGDELRREYDRALNHLDPQAVRRLVRQFLTAKRALYIDGPYFLSAEEHAIQLRELIHRLGSGVCHVLPVADTPAAREIVASGQQMEGTNE